MWVQKETLSAPRQPEPSIRVDYFRDRMEIFDAKDELNCVLPTGAADARDNGTCRCQDIEDTQVLRDYLEADLHFFDSTPSPLYHPTAI